MNTLFGIDIRKEFKLLNLSIDKHELFHEDIHYKIQPILPNDFFTDYTVIVDSKSDKIDSIIAKSKQLIPVWSATNITAQMEEYFYEKYWNMCEMDSKELGENWRSITFSNKQDNIVPLKPEFKKFCQIKDSIDTQLDMICFGTSSTLKTIEICLSRLPRPIVEELLDEDFEEDEYIEFDESEINFDTKGL